MGKLRGVTNHREIGERLASAYDVAIHDFDTVLGLPWYRRRAMWRSMDGVIINSDGDRLLRAALELRLSQSGAQLLAIDLHVPVPRSFGTWVRSRVARALLPRVDRFYLYQHDISGFDRLYGIANRCEYLHFKCNVWERLVRGELCATDRGYVLHAGRSNRDMACFIEACWRQPATVVLLVQAASTTQAHGTTWNGLDLPPWVQLVVDGDDRSTFDAYLAGARLVVITVRPGAITPSGLSTLLDAMALGKCTIISEGPATRGIVADGEAVVVPAGDSVALADAMGRCLHDEETRTTIARNAERAAMQFEGAERLHRDLAERIARRMTITP